MALRSIRTYGDEILRKKAKDVKKINEGTFKLLDDMLDTLRDRNGLGLAAPQVGVLRRIAIIEMEENLYEMINPKIVSEYGEQRRNEACLSVPGKCGDLERPAHVKVEALDRNGVMYTLEGDDLLAAAICHELDHLDGVLFLDRADNIRDNDAATVETD
ncbi:MAG: peptide deformylase [Defluviitaleaceae bacterium]|nr:peptide deformylase [Defluviitaleaceae bacterium]